MSQRQLHSDTDSGPVTRGHQLRRYRDVTRYPEVDHAHKDCFSTRKSQIKKAEGRTQSWRFEQVNRCCHEVLRMRKRHEWRLAWANRRVLRHRVGEVTHSLAYFNITQQRFLVCVCVCVVKI